jgi:8-oxo-dGTP pyrophosphatase MutT (NUDIX family)
MSKLVTVHHFDGATSEVETSKLTWRPSAYGIVIRDGKLLLLKQTNGYDLPGGGLDLGESLESAVIREVKEESGLEVANPTLIAATSSFYKLHRTEDKFIQALMYYYVCELVGGELSNAGFDEWEREYAIGPEWVPLEQLNDIKIGTSVDFRKYIPL